jgi:hypothetical protein
MDDQMFFFSPSLLDTVLDLFDVDIVCLRLARLS